MSWVIKASPEPIRVIRTEEDLPETRKMFCIIDDGLWLYGIWPAEDAPPQRRWGDVTGDAKWIIRADSVRGWVQRAYAGVRGSSWDDKLSSAE